MTFKLPTPMPAEQTSVELLDDAGEVIAILYAGAAGFSVCTQGAWMAEFAASWKSGGAGLTLHVNVSLDPRPPSRKSQPRLPARS